MCKWGSESADVEPQFKPDAFDDINPQCVNPYVNVFVRVANRLAANLAKEVHICITASCTLRNEDVCRYNIPMANEVAMIIPGELREVGNRDVIV
jgi:hypothetical protein